MNKNRYLSFVGGNPARRTAIRVKFLNLPPPFHVWNNAVLWAGTPREVSEQSGLTNATPPVFTAAALGCTPHYEDWSLRGTVNVYHAGIVPRGRYAVQVIDEECVVSEANFSAVLELSSSAWADVAGPFNIATRSWRPPDGRVDVTVDVVAVLEKFRNSLTAPIKARADLEPATADQQVNISDVTRGLDSFRSLPFPFAPGGASPCP
jgi:hypothetical protein